MKLLQQRMGLGRWWLLAVLVLGPVQPWAVSEKAAEQRQYQDTKTRQRQAVGQACANQLESLQAALQGAVSYTHLTLPTICSV